MTTKVSSLEPWVETRNTLAENLTSALALVQDEPFSDDPGSVFQRGEREIDRIFAAMRSHALNGLKQIDDAIAAGDLVARLDDLSAQARTEADRLNVVTKTIAKLTRAVDKAERAVAGFASLPFV